MYRTNFEEYYIRARDLEGRLLSDEEVKLLPHIKKSNPHFTEWRKRQNSAFLVYEYLEKHKGSKLLDLGCGNGWMTNYFSDLHETSLGIDINNQEIEQAKRVFGNSNLNFKCCDIFHSDEIGKFDTILISAALQYFENPKKLIRHLLKNHINKNGRVIIMDTFFYLNKDLENAKTRSRDYYTKLNCPEMVAHYFHHTENIFSDFKVDFVYRAKTETFFDRVVKRLFNLNNKYHLSPFNIYSIKN